jgi:hypothetical protein
MRGVAEGAELIGGLVQRIEIVEELLFGQLFFGEAPLGLVMGVDEVLHDRSPWLGGGSKVMYMHDICQMFMGLRISGAMSVLLLGIPGGPVGQMHHAARMR